MFNILNKEQSSAANILQGPLLIVAGPGSGKTRVLISRIINLVKTGVNPSDILAVTFTNKAAKEIKERLLVEVLETDLGSTWVGTFHSVCLRLLRANPSIAPVNPGFTILDDSDSKNIIKNILKDLNKMSESSDVKRMQSLISSLKSRDPLVDENTLTLSDLEIFKEYVSILNKTNCLDFDDIILKTLVMLESDNKHAQNLRGKFKHILVDEFQDTNTAQYDVVKLLGSKADSTCVVGDFDQSIYSWRGGTPEALSWFTSDFPNAKVVTLTHNYRSSSNIVNVCKGIIKNNYAPYRSELVPTLDEGDPVVLKKYDSDLTEAKGVIEDYRTTYGSSAIIFRINAQSRLFEEELTRKGLKYNMVGSLKFYDRAEIKDIISYLRLTINPNDFVAYSRAVSVPKRGLGKVTLDKIYENSSRFGFNLLETSSNAHEFINGRTSDKVKDFVENITNLKYVIQEEGLASGCNFVYTSFLKPHYFNEPERLENLGEFISAAKIFESDVSVLVNNIPVSSLPREDQVAAFLENISLSSSSDGTEDPNALTLITAHASKGREFDNVWVAGLEEGIFPHFFSDNKVNIEEERRLLYVAASRARKKLTFTSSSKRMFYGKEKRNQLSRFALDIDFPRREKDFSHNTAVNKATDSYEPVKVNDVVYHAKFGEGVVTNLESETATVSFKDGVRILSLKYAKLVVKK